MTRNDLLILSPSETLPQGRIESILGFAIEFEPTRKSAKDLFRG